MGIIRNMSHIDYRAAPGVNFSTLKSMLISPLQYRHDRDTPREDTPAMALGRATHTSVLEPDQFALEYAVFRGPRRAGKTWDAFEAANADRTILKVEEYETALSIRDAVRRNASAHSLLTGGTPEVSLFWDDAATGLRCKARLDYVQEAEFMVNVVDLKTTRTIEPTGFMREAASRGYHLQAGWYAHAYEAATGRRPDAFHFVSAQNAPPHDVVVYIVPRLLLDAGYRECVRLLERVAECERTQRWPGIVGDAVLDLELPPWAVPAGSAADGLDFGEVA